MSKRYEQAASNAPQRHSSVLEVSGDPDSILWFPEDPCPRLVPNTSIPQLRDASSGREASNDPADQLRLPDGSALHGPLGYPLGRLNSILHRECSENHHLQIGELRLTVSIEHSSATELERRSLEAFCDGLEARFPTSEPTAPAGFFIVRLRGEPVRWALLDAAGIPWCLHDSVDQCCASLERHLENLAGLVQPLHRTSWLRLAALKRGSEVLLFDPLFLYDTPRLLSAVGVEGWAVVSSFFLGIQGDPCTVVEPSRPLTPLRPRGVLLPEGAAGFRGLSTPLALRWALAVYACVGFEPRFFDRSSVLWAANMLAQTAPVATTSRLTAEPLIALAQHRDQLQPGAK